MYQNVSRRKESDLQVDMLSKSQIFKLKLVFIVKFLVSIDQKSLIQKPNVEPDLKTGMSIPFD